MIIEIYDRILPAETALFAADAVNDGLWRHTRLFRIERPFLVPLANHGLINVRVVPLQGHTYIDIRLGRRTEFRRVVTLNALSFQHFTREDGNVWTFDTNTTVLHTMTRIRAYLRLHTTLAVMKYLSVSQIDVLRTVARNHTATIADFRSAGVLAEMGLITANFDLTFSYNDNTMRISTLMRRMREIYDNDARWWREEMAAHLHMWGAE